MDRKRFLRNSSLVTAAFLPGRALLPPFSNSNFNEEGEHARPPDLKSGDRIGITSPAGFISEKDVAPAVERLREWGFNVKLGKTVGKRYYTFGGTDEERLNDFQEMLDDEELTAILCARGGYGFVRIIDRLRFDRFRKFPKWIIGFSDVTVLHAHLHRHAGTTSLHAKMCNSFPENWDAAEPEQRTSILSIRDALVGTKTNYIVPSHPQNRRGVCKGKLVGGNLKTLESLSGSGSDMQTKGKILFVEDTGEYLYSIDRMFWNLKRSGKLEGLAGLIVGGFKVKPDLPGEEFGSDLQQIVCEKVKEFEYPVCFDFPVGHQKNNVALKCGVVHELEVGEAQVILREP
jgi:muramoyltetrapeptide carboxypeptidase